MRLAYLRAVAAFALIALVVACSGSHPSPPTPVPASALDALLLPAADINAVMGTNAMVANAPFTTPSDNRRILPNLNCLGIWQVGEDAIYADSGFAGIRGQRLRQPDADNWEALVVQAVANYPSADAAQKFFAASADRWSKCTNHRVNITVNDQPKVTWFFGNLTKIDTELTIPVTRGENERLCQRALSVDNNIILDVRACSGAITDQAATITQKIKDRFPS